VQAEGRFTMEGGGKDLFVDRIESQDEIHKLIEEVFG
jgi:hypothetical protein